MDQSDYLIISDNNEKLFTEKVNDTLNLGYKLAGGLFVTITPNETIFYQSVYKEIEENFND